MKEEIKKELDQRGWSVIRLAKETGIRYPSLSEYFAGRKELNSKNIEVKNWNDICDKYKSDKYLKKHTK